jgi:di/tripeptidase
VSPGDPFVNMVRKSAEEIFGSAVISISSAGTGPMNSFINILKSPCVSIGSTFVYAKIHSPNEFARIDLLNKATKCICNIIDRLSGSE